MTAPVLSRATAPVLSREDLAKAHQLWRGTGTRNAVNTSPTADPRSAASAASPGSAGPGSMPSRCCGRHKESTRGPGRSWHPGIREAIEYLVNDAGGTLYLTE
jgi:hypothetical protein